MTAPGVPGEDKDSRAATKTPRAGLVALAFAVMLAGASAQRQHTPLFPPQDLGSSKARTGRVGCAPTGSWTNWGSAKQA